MARRCEMTCRELTEQYDIEDGGGIQHEPANACLSVWLSSFNHIFSRDYCFLLWPG